jgi:hypothetical protein
MRTSGHHRALHDAVRCNHAVTAVPQRDSKKAQGVHTRCSAHTMIQPQLKLYRYLVERMLPGAVVAILLLHVVLASPVVITAVAAVAAIVSQH